MLSLKLPFGLGTGPIDIITGKILVPIANTSYPPLTTTSPFSHMAIEFANPPVPVVDEFDILPVTRYRLLLFI
jgi:hypothetical protein